MADGHLLRGFGFSGFRSFAPGRPQRIGPLSKVHLLAGANNAGKSNALVVARRALPALRNNKPFQCEGTDRPAAAPANDDRRFRLAVGTHCSHADLEQLTSDIQHRQVRVALADALRGSGTLADDTLWIEYQAHDQSRQPGWQLDTEQSEALAKADEATPRASMLTNAANALGPTGQRSVVGAAHGILKALAARAETVPTVPDVLAISAFREVGVDRNTAGHDDEYRGGDVIGTLARCQAPTVDHRDDRDRFVAINRFVKTLFDDDDAALEVAHDGQSLSVYHNGLWLPLENYGTGLHQVVILAVAATVYSGRLICIEEPEVNLHPALHEHRSPWCGARIAQPRWRARSSRSSSPALALSWAIEHPT